MSTTTTTKRQRREDDGDGGEDGDSLQPESSLQAVVGYHCKAANIALLTPGQLELVRRIKLAYLVPADFETNVRRFGPLSGLTFEERLITSYEWGLLAPRTSSSSNQAEGFTFCWKCGKETDHLARQGCKEEAGED